MGKGHPSVLQVEVPRIDLSERADHAARSATNRSHRSRTASLSDSHSTALSTPSLSASMTPVGTAQRCHSSKCRLLRTPAPLAPPPAAFILATIVAASSSGPRDRMNAALSLPNTTTLSSSSFHRVTRKAREPAEVTTSSACAISPPGYGQSWCLASSSGLVLGLLNGFAVAEVHALDHLGEALRAVQPAPVPFGGLGELEDHGERGLA